MRARSLRRARRGGFGLLRPGALAQLAEVLAAPRLPQQEARGTGQRAVEGTAPVAGHGADDHRAAAVGAQGQLAALVDAAAGTVHVRQLHFGARHPRLQAAQRKAQALLGQLAQAGGLGIAGGEDDLHRGSPKGLHRPPP